MYKIEDIKPNSLVVFKKHNGKGRRITTRIVFIDFIQDNYICYHTYTGHTSAFIDLNEAEIMAVYPMNEEGKFIQKG